MTIKRKRGRPRKPIPRRERLEIAFKSIEVNQTEENVRIAAGFLRDYTTLHPHMADPKGVLKKWLDAMADALEANDALRVAVYATDAMKQYAVNFVELEVQLSTGKSYSLHELVDAGHRKLVADKRRGHKGRW